MERDFDINPQNSKETYLPTLQALPGKTELTYLPSNTQIAVMIPIRPPKESSSSIRNSVLVLGGNTAKSFTPRDIAWSRIVAEKIGEELWLITAAKSMEESKQFENYFIQNLEATKEIIITLAKS